MPFLAARWRAASLAAAILACGCGKVASPAQDATVENDAAVDDAPSDAPAPSSISLTAGMTMPILGTSGDPFTDHCAAGQALVGFNGATTMIGSLHLVGLLVGHCSALELGAPGTDGYAVTAETGVLLPARGAASTPWPASAALCAPNQFVVGLAVRAGSELDALAVQCAPVTLVAQPTGWVGQIGAVTTRPQQGGNGGNPLTARCPDGQVATVSNPKVVAASGSNPAVLGAIGIGCSVVAGR